MMKHVHMEADLPLTWDILCKKKRKSYSGIDWILLHQTFAAVFSGAPYVPQGAVYSAAVTFLQGGGAYAGTGKVLKYIPYFDLPCEFTEPARQGDLAKLVFLLDVAMDPAYVRENLVPFLLNEKQYGLIMELEGLKEELCKVPEKNLREHWLALVPQTAGEQAFCRYVFPLLDQEHLVETIRQRGQLSSRIWFLLNNGISPDSYILERNVLKVTLREYLYFADELSEALSVPDLDNYQLKILRKDLKAAQKFLKWERENSASAKS